MSEAHVNFVRQQGFDTASATTCNMRYPALMFQPRAIGAIVLIAILFQSAALFLVLSAVLWWSALVPKLNPFEALYNGLVASRRGLPLLTVALGPRRFSQGIAATFTLVIALLLRARWTAAAWLLEALLLGALAALIFGTFCLGSYLFHLLTGNAAFANRTTPWARAGSR
jgi:hypothetical protein